MKFLTIDSKLLDSLFLIFLGTLGGMIGNGITACKIQKLIHGNIYIKHFLFIIIIYFTISYVYESNDKKNDDVKEVTASNSILDIFSKTAIIYGLFILLMKNNYKCVIIVFLILFFNKIASQYIEKLSIDKKNIKQIESINKNRFYSTMIAGIVLVGGFVFYYFEKKKEYKNQFNNITFIFGSNQCKSLL